MSVFFGVILFILFLVVLKSWGDCGSDHEENVSEEYPDGRLTYPGDEE